jgi:hypothetical protein
MPTPSLTICLVSATQNTASHQRACYKCAPLQFRAFRRGTTYCAAAHALSSGTRSRRATDCLPSGQEMHARVEARDSVDRAEPARDCSGALLSSFTPHPSDDSDRGTRHRTRSAIVSPGTTWRNDDG